MAAMAARAGRDGVADRCLTRYADTWTHLRPAWYYLLQVIPWAWLPATLALPWLLPAWWRRLAAGDARYALLLGYVVAVVVFFSLSPGKRGVYLLPALPAFVLAAAPLLDAAMLRRAGLRRVCAALGAVIGVAGLGAAAVLASGVLGLGARAARMGFAGSDVALVLAALGLAGVVFTAGGMRVRREPAALALLLTAGWLIYAGLGYPVMNDARSARDLMTQVEAMAPPSHPLALAGWKEQMILQARRPVVHFGYRRESDEELRDAAAWLAAEPGAWLLIPAEQMGPCLEAARARPVAVRHRRAWMLADASALTGACGGEGARSAVRLYDPAAGRLLIPH